MSVPFTDDDAADLRDGYGPSLVKVRWPNAHSRAGLLSVDHNHVAGRGDHVCAVYSTTAELAEAVARFLADGLRSLER